MSNINEMQWPFVQKFARDYPQFEYYWNWHLDFRHTGHHYNLLEKLAAFAKAQPRKGLWELNERFYITAVHGPITLNSTKSVELVSGSDMIWSSPPNTSITPVGPARPTIYPKRIDTYEV
jgi:hypothetical protein